MKASKYILIIGMGLLFGLSNTALGRPSVSVRTGNRQRGFRNSYRSDYKRGSNQTCRQSYYNRRGWCRRNYRYRRRFNVSRSVYRYDRNLGYCVAVSPMIIEKQTVIVSTTPSEVVQPQQFDENTLQLNIQLQKRKIELLEQIQMSDKNQRIEAIRELAGFSFDDKIRNVLESILLTDQDAELRIEAAKALGNTNNVKTLAALEKARIEDSNEEIRKAADEAIKKLGGN